MYYSFRIFNKHISLSFFFFFFFPGGICSFIIIKICSSRKESFPTLQTYRMWGKFLLMNYDVISGMSATNTRCVHPGAAGFLQNTSVMWTFKSYLFQHSGGLYIHPVSHTPEYFQISGFFNEITASCIKMWLQVIINGNNML